MARARREVYLFKVSRSEFFFMLVVVVLFVKFTSHAVKEQSGDNKKNVHIFMASDGNFVPPTMVALISLFENGNPITFYNVHVLVPGNFESESKANISSLERRYRNCKIVFVDMGNKYKNAPRIHVTYPTYYRLGIPSLFSDLNKCIYIDSDVIIRHDLWEMFNTNVDDYYVAGIYAGYQYSKIKEKARFELLGLPNLKQYICSGVIIMNLKKMREDRIEENFSKFIEEKGKYLQEITYFYAEQEVLNMVCYGKILLLPIEFGLMINIMQKAENPIIVHFAGKPKPWEKPERTKFHWEFLYYARKTTFYRNKINLGK